MTDTSIKIGMKPPHPGAFVREEVLVPLDFSVGKAASLLGISRNTLTRLVNENSALSPEMALRIEKAFGIDMDTMLRMQAWFDATAMRERADEIDVQRYDLM